MGKMPDPTDHSLVAQFRSTKPVLSNLAFDYLRVRDGSDQAKHESFDKTQDEIKLRDDQLTLEQVSRTVNIPRSILIAQAEQKRRAGHVDDQIFFIALLNDLQERLAQIEERMAQRLEFLSGRYGSDVVGGMADTFLSDAERAGLETDEEKLAALAKKFLDRDGNIKEKYKHLEEAQYVRDWNEARKLRPIVEKYKNRDHLTPEEQQEVREAAGQASLADNKNLALQSQNSQLQQTVDDAIDQKANQEASRDLSTDYHFR
ncbi:MAG: hypothetical protein ACU85E_16140 [Gammaproteobacteria bacterium]